MKRKLAREQAFVILFESSFQKDNSMSEIIDLYNELSEQWEHIQIPEKIDDFAKSIALGVEEKIGELNEYIEKYAVGWKIARIPKVTLSILRLSMYEMKYMDVPVGVSINEAVDIAKKYSTKEDASFINGILGSFSKELEI